jgi:hypothetical protein
MPSYPEVNDRAYSYSSIEIAFGNDIYTAVKSINYSDNMEPGELRGTAQHMLGRTAGEYKADASCEMSLAAWEILKGKLGAGFLLKSMQITVSYGEPNVPLVQDEIIGVRIKKVGRDNAQGTEASMVKLEFHVMYIVHNGVIPFEFRRPGVA